MNRRGVNGRTSHPDLSMQDTDLTFISTGRPSVDRAFMGSIYEYQESTRSGQRQSNVSDLDFGGSFESSPFDRASLDTASPLNFCSFSESERLSASSMPVIYHNPRFIFRINF